MNSDSEPRASAAGLTYPFAARPDPGTILEVAGGVYWIRMPLPMSLNHINLWALADGDGWTLVDTGMNTAEITAAWEKLLSGPLAEGRVKRIICTHMHPDHVGMAGWLTRRFRAPLWMTRLEYVTCRMLVADTGREAPTDALQFYKAAGWNAQELERYKTQFGEFGKAVYALPDSFHRVSANDEFVVGRYTWRTLIGTGHSPEHLCLYCPELRLLISGDQVLPKITSNVSVFPVEPDADPLSDWLESLASITREIPDDVLVLPAHNDPFHGLHARTEQLIRGHESSLTLLADALSEPKIARDVFGLLFRRPVPDSMLQFATGESVAHLNCLMRRGRITRWTDEAGIAWYQSR
jgi:glyoxylase-like metal-dependent hydrolase (beta-lactamase superfamily II)